MMVVQIFILLAIYAIIRRDFKSWIQRRNTQEQRCQSGATPSLANITNAPELKNSVLKDKLNRWRSYLSIAQYQTYQVWWHWAHNHWNGNLWSVTTAGGSLRPMVTASMLLTNTEVPWSLVDWQEGWWPASSLPSGLCTFLPKVSGAVTAWVTLWALRSMMYNRPCGTKRETSFKKSRNLFSNKNLWRENSTRAQK